MATVRTPDLLVARLEEQVRELRAALEDAAEGICRVDTDGRVISVNRAFSRLTGYEAAEIVGRSWETTVSAADRPLVRADLQNAKEKVERDVHGARKDGTPFDMQLSVVPIVDLQSTRPGPKGHYFFIRDLTDRRRMENQLIFAGRMAAVGTLAAGVAHEINNPLAYIVANIDFVRQQITTYASRVNRQSSGSGDMGRSLDEAGEALAEARQGAERVRNIVRDLRVFARGDEEQSGPVALRRVLDSSINIAWNEIRHRARLVKDYGDPPMVESNESRLGQVFLNLLLNAAHAIPEGETERNEIRVSTRTDGRGYAVVEIRDTGVGIPAEIRDRIFDPFFTTKPAGEGTGLGLWICSGILSALGGEISVDSDKGKGSVFRVSLPPVAMETPAAIAAPATGRRGRAGRAAADRRRRTDDPGCAPPVVLVGLPRDVRGRRPARAGTDPRGRALRRHPVRPHDAGDHRHGPLRRAGPPRARSGGADRLRHGRRLHAARARVPGEHSQRARREADRLPESEAAATQPSFSMR